MWLHIIAAPVARLPANHLSPYLVSLSKPQLVSLLIGAALTLDAAAVAGPPAASPAADDTKVVEATPREGDFVTRVRRLTYEGKRAGEGYFCPMARSSCSRASASRATPSTRSTSSISAAARRSASRPGWARPPVRSCVRGRARSCSPPPTTIRGRSTCSARSSSCAPRARSVVTPGTTTRRWSSTSPTPVRSPDRTPWARAAASHQRARLRRRSQLLARREVDRVLLDAQRLRGRRGAGVPTPSAPRTRDRPLLLRRDLHHAGRGRRATAVDQRCRATTAGRSSSPTARGSCGGASPRTAWWPTSGRMKPDGSDQRRITDFGAMSWAPWRTLGPLYPVRLQQARLFELRDLSGRRRGQEGAGAGDLQRRIRRPARAVARRSHLAWTSTRHGEQGGQIFVGQWNDAAALRGHRRRADAGPSVIARPGLHRRRAALAIAATPRSASDLADLAELRADVERLAAPELGGRLTGSEGERRAADFLAGELSRSAHDPSPARTICWCRSSSRPAP